MNENELKDMLDNPVADIVSLLPDLSPPDVLALRALEAGEGGKKRATLLKAIDDFIAEQGGESDTESDAGNADDTSVEETSTPPSAAEGGSSGGSDAAADSFSNKDVRGETPDWQKPDYDGPMTIEISDWRNKNLKVSEDK